MILPDVADMKSKQTKGQSSLTGLKNLGATCYANSMLQLLFHNLNLRRAIYRWDHRHDPKEREARQRPVTTNAVNAGDSNSGTPVVKHESNDDDEEPIDRKPVIGPTETVSQMINNEDDIHFTPVSAIGHLQRVFALLHFGHFDYVDPSDFVRVLEVDEHQQQDAQEFCKLFLNVLEQDLDHQSDPEIKRIIQSEFVGEYSYITQCTSCKGEKLDPSKFYELSLNMEGFKRLEECLSQFFASEVMEGSNAYNCATCGPDQRATRSIGLTSLPPTLNVQLLRFVYDRTKGARKKITNEISFPETLDMAHYFKSCVKLDADQSTTYQLTAVLSHIGKSCEKGHYLAQIRDPGSGQWYKFNDETVELMEKKKFKKDLDILSQTSDPGVDASKSSGTSASQSGASNNNNKRKTEKRDPNRLYSCYAYMLVYQVVGRESPATSGQ